MATLARTQGLYIVAGSHPVEQADGTLQNVSMIFRPDGSYVSQPKLHITPSEKTWWGITGGDAVVVVELGLLELMELLLKPEMGAMDYHLALQGRLYITEVVAAEVYINKFLHLGQEV